MNTAPHDPPKVDYKVMHFALLALLQEQARLSQTETQI